MAILDPTPPPAPRKGEIIFRSDSSFWPANANVGHMAWLGDRDPPYSEGYRMAARQLAVIEFTTISLVIQWVGILVIGGLLLLTMESLRQESETAKVETTPSTKIMVTK